MSNSNTIMSDSIKPMNKGSMSQSFVPLRTRTNSVKTIDTVVYSPRGSDHVDIHERPVAPNPIIENNLTTEPAGMLQYIENFHQKTVRFNSPNPVTSTRQILHAIEPPAMLHADEIRGQTPGLSNTSQPGPIAVHSQFSYYTSLIPPETVDDPDLQTGGTQPATKLESDGLDLNFLGPDDDEASVESDPSMSQPALYTGPSPSPRPKYIMGNPAVPIQEGCRQYVHTATDSEQAIYEIMMSFPPANEKKELVYFLDAQKFETWKSKDIEKRIPYIGKSSYSINSSFNVGLTEYSDFPQAKNNIPGIWHDLLVPSKDTRIPLSGLLCSSWNVHDYHLMGQDTMEILVLLSRGVYTQVFIHA